MITVTNQLLYNAYRTQFKELGVTEDISSEAYYSVQEDLANQSGFSDDLVNTCASIAFDAALDHYNEVIGEPVDSLYSDETIENLFSVDSQEVFATWVGRLASHIGGAAKGVKLGVKYFGNSGKYVYDTHRYGSAKERKAERNHGSGFFGRIAAGHDSYLAKRKQISELKANPDYWRKQGSHYRQTKGTPHWDKSESSREKSRKDANDWRGKKGFFGRFKDDKNSFMGMGKDGQGIKTWAKNNKTQAAVAGVGAAALTGAAAYGTYRMLRKKREDAAKAKQQPQVVIQNGAPQPNR